MTFTAVDAIDFDVAPGRGVRLPRPERRRQDLDDADDRLRLARRRRGRSRSWAWTRARDGPRIRARIGVVPQQDTLDTEMTVRENLVIYGRYFGLSYREAGRRADELLDFVQLTDRAKSTVEPLSGGMKRRITIARSLINEPDLLLLDEPTTGLDPQARHQLWDRLYRLKQRGVTLVLTTHYMDEAEQLCDRLVVMDKAKIAAEGTPARAHRALFDPRGRRAALPGRHPGDARTERRSSTGATSSASIACRIACSSTPTTVKPRRSRSTTGVSGPRACSSAGARSRTSSCA